LLSLTVWLAVALSCLFGLEQKPITLKPTHKRLEGRNCSLWITISRKAEETPLSRIRITHVNHRRRVTLAYGEVLGGSVKHTKKPRDGCNKCVEMRKLRPPYEKP